MMKSVVTNIKIITSIGILGLLPNSVFGQVDVTGAFTNAGICPIHSKVKALDPKYIKCSVGAPIQKAILDKVNKVCLDLSFVSKSLRGSEKKYFCDGQAQLKKSKLENLKNIREYGKIKDFLNKSNSCQALDKLVLNSDVDARVKELKAIESKIIEFESSIQKKLSAKSWACSNTLSGVSEKQKIFEEISGDTDASTDAELEEKYFLGNLSENDQFPVVYTVKNWNLYKSRFPTKPAFFSKTVTVYPNLRGNIYRFTLIVRKGTTKFAIRSKDKDFRNIWYAIEMEDKIETLRWILIMSNRLGIKLTPEEVGAPLQIKYKDKI